VLSAGKRALLASNGLEMAAIALRHLDAAGLRSQAGFLMGPDDVGRNALGLAGIQQRHLETSAVAGSDSMKRNAL